MGFLDPGTVCHGVLGKGMYCHNESPPAVQPKKPKESSGQILR